MIRKGDVYFADLSDNAGVNTGLRPVIIVSSNAGNRTSNLVTVVPITTKCKPLSCNADIDWSQHDARCQALCNQLITIPQSALNNYKGRLTPEELTRVEKALLVSLGIREVE